MNFAKQFIQKENKTNTSKVASNIAAAIGITAIGMTDTIVNDIYQMLEKEQRYSLEGYVLCLSRIISHKLAWECIHTAFRKKGEPIPKKYFPLFHEEEETSPPLQNQVVT